MSTGIYHFEDVVENTGGFKLNERVQAVYELSGFIHRSYRNAGGETPGKPVWSYVKRGGELTGIESTVSLDDLKAQLGGGPKPGATHQVPQRSRSLKRLFIGLHRKGGGLVNRETVLKILAAQLDTFTVTDTLGYYEGRPEPTLVVEVAQTKEIDLEPLARDLADAFDQDAVGIESDGLYTRIFSEKKRTIAKLADKDRQQLNKFTRALNSGKPFDELDAELQAWWLNRY